MAQLGGTVRLRGLLWDIKAHHQPMNDNHALTSPVNDIIGDVRYVADTDVIVAAMRSPGGASAGSSVRRGTAG